MTVSFHRRPHGVLRVPVALALLAIAAGCGGGDGAGLDDGGGSGVEFAAATADVGTNRSIALTLTNRGDRGIGPVTFALERVADAAGRDVQGASITTVPERLGTLAPGASVSVTVLLSADPLAAGAYEATVAALADSVVVARATVGFAVAEPPDNGARAIAIEGVPATLRQGDVADLAARVLDEAGAELAGAPVSWFLLPSTAGEIEADALVAYEPGSALLIARSGRVDDTLAVTIEPRGVAGAFTTVSVTPPPSRALTDLWVHGNYAYTGTRPNGNDRGDALYTWDVTDPLAPVLTSTLVVDAGQVNDIKVRADGALAVLTHEASTDGLNGITLLSLADPAQPIVITRFTDQLQSGVHNVWIEGDFVYAAVDGGGQGLRVIDVSDPASPSVVATFRTGTSFVHDVYVRDGLAFVSYWNEGLVILDVGNGVAGGSPHDPRLVSRILLDGQTHNAWYWPAGGYVFVGEEDFQNIGVMHVVDVRDLTQPREVATFAVPGQTPHNFWLDEANQVLYAAWYDQGLRALDVSGRLLGRLERQGREYTPTFFDRPPGPGGAFTWAPQLHGGLVYASDISLGLLVVTPPL